MKEIDSNLNIQKKFNLKIKEAKYYHNEICEILQSLSYKEKFNIVKEVDRNLLKKVNINNINTEMLPFEYMDIERKEKFRVENEQTFKKLGRIIIPSKVIIESTNKNNLSQDWIMDNGFFSSINYIKSEITQ
jgi:hypothetical protein